MLKHNVMLMIVVLSTVNLGHAADKGLLASYFTGYGAENLGRIIVEDWGVEYAEKQLKILGLNPKSKKGELVVNQIKAVAAAMGVAVEESIGQGLNALLSYLDFEVKDIGKIANAFEAGTKFNVVLNTALLPSIQLAWMIGVQTLGGQSTRYLFDILNPPLKLYHGKTASYCGPRNPYCMYEEGVRYYYCYPGVSDPACAPIKHFYCSHEDPACRPLLSLDSLRNAAQNYAGPVFNFIASASVGFALSSVVYSLARYLGPKVTDLLVEKSKREAMYEIVKATSKKFFFEQAWQMKDTIFILLDHMSGNKSSAWLKKQKLPFKYGKYSEILVQREKGKTIKITEAFLKDLQVA